MLNTLLKGLTRQSGAPRRPQPARPWQRPDCYPLKLEALEERYLLDYSIALLTLGGFESYAYGINNTGEVTGASYTAGNSAYHAFFRDTEGTITDLGTLGGFNYSVGSGINSAGQVVGWSYPPGDQNFHAVFWDSDGTIRDLGGGFESNAYGINNAGQVVGSAIGGAGVVAVRWNSDGSTTYLGGLGGTDSYAYAINNAGQIAGWSYTANGLDHAVLWGSDGAITDLGTLGGCCSRAAAINDSGQVTGWSVPLDGGQVHAAIWNPDGTRRDLGTLGGFASSGEGINSAGQVVGASYIPSGAVHAAFWDSDGTITDLNTQIPPDSGWELGAATAINDAGQIVGWGRLNGGFNRAFLLTPNSLPAGHPPAAAARQHFTASPDASTSLLPASGAANNVMATPPHFLNDEGVTLGRTVPFPSTIRYPAVPLSDTAGSAPVTAASSTNGVANSDDGHADDSLALAPVAVDPVFCSADLLRHNLLGVKDNNDYLRPG
jgi:probable HAF family extracellular repeat protein